MNLQVQFFNKANTHRASQWTKHALCSFLLLAMVPLAQAEEIVPATRDAQEHFFHQSFMNFEEEVETAREEGQRGLFVMFNDPDCPWCHKMKTTVMNRTVVQNFYRKHFRLIHLDTKGDTLMVNFDGTEMTEKDFAFKMHRVRATPVFIFFDLQGNILLRYTGATRNTEEFLWLGEYIINEEYKNKKFAVYKRERLAQKK